MGFLIPAGFFAPAATLAQNQDAAAYLYWFGGHFVALLLAVPLFLRLYKQQKGVGWSVILRTEWGMIVFRLAAFLIAVAVVIRQGDERFQPTGLVANLQSFAGGAVVLFYLLVAPVMAYYVSKWKKRSAAWALVTLLIGPGCLLMVSLSPEREKAHDPILPKGLIRFFIERRPASLYRPPDPDPHKAWRDFKIDLALYAAIGIVFLALFVWFVMATRPAHL